MEHSYVYRQQNLEPGLGGEWGNLKTLLRADLCLKHEYTETQKGTANPAQTWTGAAGSKRLRLPNFETVVT